ncbi:MAG: PEP-CTERM sorting domain-containing protein [Deltaproteobacteria bacterium]|nr:PEP-CTERM sorting domain-containing protein [Deltaproteobacteria bacterium]MBW2417885.1 PEP-CTERM sorting domain-containing protein [Deltaproteobacteria bacterium]
MRSFHFALALFCICVFAASAQATSLYTPLIDFRDEDPWADAEYETHYTGTQSGVSLTIRANPSPATFWQDDKDGLGVRLSYEKDEIEAEEVLEVVFNTTVAVSAIYISDLFIERGYVETGSYRINRGTWVEFDAKNLPGTGARDSNGEHIIDLGGLIGGVQLVEFRAPGKFFEDEHHEFALMGFDAIPAEVPEPSTALLLGIGLVGLAARRR